MQPRNLEKEVRQNREGFLYEKEVERRDQIMKILEQSDKPVSGMEFAKLLHVSRQVIVQDIALLRAENKNILSTNRGYLLYRVPDERKKIQRIVYVNHTKEQIRDELYTIVDIGGKVLNVMIEHDIYGQISANLLLSTRKDVDKFVSRVEHADTRPLNCLTDGTHYHTIEAESEEILDEIEEELEKKKYLIKK